MSSRRDSAIIMQLYICLAAGRDSEAWRKLPTQDGILGDSKRPGHLRLGLAKTVRKKWNKQRIPVARQNHLLHSRIRLQLSIRHEQRIQTSGLRRRLHEPRLRLLRRRSPGRRAVLHVEQWLRPARNHCNSSYNRGFRLCMSLRLMALQESQ